MQQLHGSIRQGFQTFKNQYERLVEQGESFIKEGIFKGWKMGHYVELKDEMVFFLYRNFPDLYDKHLKNEPQLPRVSPWYYILNHVLWLPEKRLNRIWWPKYGDKIVNYMNFYNSQLGEAINEIEATYEISEIEEPTPENSEDGSGDSDGSDGTDGS